MLYAKPSGDSWKSMCPSISESTRIICGCSTKDTLNKSLNASAFTPSFLRRQEPKTLWAELRSFARTDSGSWTRTTSQPSDSPFTDVCQGTLKQGPKKGIPESGGAPGQNKSLNANALTPSFLRRQEPKTLWAEVPAFAGTTGRDRNDG